VRYGEVVVGGFPLKIDVVVADVAIGGSLDDVAWTWSAPTVGALLRPWRFDGLLLALPPAHDLVLVQGGREHRVALGQATNQIALVSDDGQLSVLGFDATGLSLADTEGTAIAVADMKLRVERRDDDGAVNLGVQIGGLDLPAAPPEFPQTLTSMTLVASLVGNLPGGPPRAALAAWRDAGGTVETERFHLIWGQLDLKGDGTLALDDAFRPIGAFHLDVAGYAQAIQSAVAAGLLEPTAGSAVRAVLDLIAKPAAEGGAARADVALSLQDGTVFVGPVAVGKVAPLPIE
jgi:hypothetical protein